MMSCSTAAPESNTNVCLRALPLAASNNLCCSALIAFLANALRPSFCTSLATPSATKSAAFFDTPEFIKLAAEQALREGKTKYAPAAGIPALRSAIADKYIRDNKFESVDASQVIVSPGGKFSCYLAILSVISPGDEVIIPAPYWVSYPEMVKLAGGVPKFISTEMEEGFKVSPEQLRAAVNANTRLLILNSPSNPTGAIYSKKEMEALVEVAMENDLYIMSDEIYEYLLYDHVEHHSPE